jgi:hypothetical protein
MTTIDRSPHALLLLALLVLSGLLFFLGLGDMGLTDRDEGRNAYRRYDPGHRIRDVRGRQ